MSGGSNSGIAPLAYTQSIRAIVFEQLKCVDYSKFECSRSEDVPTPTKPKYTLVDAEWSDTWSTRPRLYSNDDVIGAVLPSDCIHVLVGTERL